MSEPTATSCAVDLDPGRRQRRPLRHHDGAGRGPRRGRAHHPRVEERPPQGHGGGAAHLRALSPTNIAAIRDIEVVEELIALAGGTVEHDADSISISAHSFRALGEDDVERLHNASRIPILTTAVSLHRTGEAVVAAPGGCAIGPRPVDFHMLVLRALGARDEHRDGMIHLRADRLHGARIDLPFPSVGATEQFLLASVLAEGDSELANAAIEPEILDLIAVLQKMGALISVEPNRTIRVTGVDELGGFEHRVIGDRLEAASWASLALATGGLLTVEGIQQQDLSTFLNVYRRAGGDFTVDAEGRRIEFRRARRMLRPLALETDVHPGFMTDWQSPFVTALTQADGCQRGPRDRLRGPPRLHRGPPHAGRPDPGLHRVPRADPLPLRCRQPPPLRGRRGPDQAPRRRARGPRPARRLLLRDRGGRRRRRERDPRRESSRPGLRRLPRQARRRRHRPQLTATP